MNKRQRRQTFINQQIAKEGFKKMTDVAEEATIIEKPKTVTQRITKGAAVGAGFWAAVAVGTVVYRRWGSKSSN